LIILLALILITVYAKGYFSDAFSFDFSTNQDYKEGKVSFMDLATPKLSIIIFWGICILLSIATYIKKYSLIPLMGVTTCLYLLTGMTKSNWAWFLGWLGLGLIFYFLYGYRNSKLAKNI
jgi:basic amino acid/polyamine antiporter, APA family